MKESEFEELLEHEKAADVIQELRNEKDIPLILWGAGEVAVAVKKYLKQNIFNFDAFFGIIFSQLRCG